MAIVISGVNNNDKITANDGTIDLLSSSNILGTLTAPSINVTGIITATSFTGNISGTTGTFGDFVNVGSNIQLGNAGVATATTFVGNLTGNVNNTGALLLQIGGSEKFRVGGSGQLGIGGANYGTSGQVLTSGGSGSAATWSTISGTTINTNADNRVITGSGSANTLNGEANLTFDGTALGITGYTDIRTGSSINTNVTGGSASGTLHKNTNSGEFAVVSGGTGGNNYLSFYTSASASPTEKLRIASNGAFGLNGANYGSSGQVLTSQGSGSPVQWATPTSTSAKASMSTGGGTVSGQRVASDLTYSSGNNNSNVQLGNVTSCNASSVYALELSLTYMHNGSTNHGYLTGYIYQRGKTYGLVGSYVNEQHYDWYYNYTMNRFIIPWDPSGTQALDLYITNAYNTNSNNKFFVDVTNKLENI